MCFFLKKKERNIFYNKDYGFGLNKKSKIFKKLIKNTDLNNANKINSIGDKYRDTGVYYYKIFEYLLLIERAFTKNILNELKESSKHHKLSLIKKLKYHNMENIDKEVPGYDKLQLGGIGDGMFGVTRGIEISIMAEEEDTAKWMLEKVTLEKPDSGGWGAFYMAYFYKYVLLERNDDKISELIDDARKKEKLHKTWYIMFDVLEDFINKDSEKFQKDLDLLIKKKEIADRGARNLFVVRPTLWAVCILAKREGLEFEVDCRFLPKWCLEWY